MEPLPKLTDHSENPTPIKDDVMISPTDDLSLQSQLPSTPTFEVPSSWGTPSTPSTPTIPTPIGAGIIPPEREKLDLTLPSPAPKTSVLKILFTGLALVLLGILIGVLAAKLIPVVTPTTPLVAKITSEITEEITPEVTPELFPSPTATPEAMLKLTWKKYSSDKYTLHYPSTWSLKYTADKLTLTKGKNILSITNPEISSPETCESPSIHKFAKNSTLWDIQEATPSAKFIVCEAGEANTPIGEIILIGTNIDQNTLDEFKLILEKLEIISNVQPKDSTSPIISNSKTSTTCTPLYKVETNTSELSSFQNYSMYCFQKKSENECLQVDLYNQKSNDFSTPDGVPDCEWNNTTAQ